MDGVGPEVYTSGMDITFSTAARSRIRTAVRFAILARAKREGDEVVRALLGVSDGAMRGWRRGTSPSFVKAQFYAPILGLDPLTGRAVAP